ncbi:archaeal proteasome endopeptidase complex subunit beta [archaeon]|nr:archaeal proteasome endopeptidase complex subunit beta [archaeon]
MNQEKLHGTTTVGIVCKDCVVIAADKRASMGNLVAHKNTEKVLPVTDRIVMSIAGGVGDAQILVKYLRAEMKSYEIQEKKKPTVKACASLLSHILFNGKGYWPFFVQLLVAGHDEKGPSLYSLDAGGGSIPDDFISTGSGSPVAYGVLESSYKKGVSKDDGIKLAVKALSSAIQRDAFTGDGALVYVIDKKGYHKVDEKEFKKLIK